jgi:zinc transport system substrate-binding protein
MRSALRLVHLFLLLVFAACGDGGSTGRLPVTVSIEPHAWLVERIGGDRVSVAVLVGPGESPHSYQPSDLQVTNVVRSVLYFRTGVPFERGKWLSAIRSAKDLRVVDLREGVTLRTMESGHHGEEDRDHGEDAGAEALDPHIWLSPTAHIVQAEAVKDALVAADPEGRSDFESRFRELVADLVSARQQVREILAPIAGKRILVFHPAYGYFCDEFGLQQVAIEAEGKEPSDQELTALLAQARADGTRAIFVQEQISGRSAQAIAGTLGIALVRLDPLARNVPENLIRMAKLMRRAFP